jgi:hypothetical protein
MSEEEKKRILHRRWAIAWIIVIIIVTWLHLWPVVFGFLFALAMLWVVARIIDYLTGADLDTHQDIHHPSNEESTMWDIYTQDQVLNHHDHDNDGQK